MKPCQVCQTPHYRYNLVNGRCNDCRRKRTRKARKQLVNRLAFSQRIQSMISRGDTEIKNVAKVCDAMLEALKGQNLAKIIAQFLTSSDTPPPELPKKAVVATGILHCLAALEHAAALDAQKKQQRKQILDNLPQTELNDILLPLCNQLVRDNPQLAVRTLEDAGFKVTLKRKKPV